MVANDASAQGSSLLGTDQDEAGQGLDQLLTIKFFFYHPDLEESAVTKSQSTCLVSTCLVMLPPLHLFTASRQDDSIVFQFGVHWRYKLTRALFDSMDKIVGQLRHDTSGPLSAVYPRMRDTTLKILKSSSGGSNARKLLDFYRGNKDEFAALIFQLFQDDSILPSQVEPPEVPHVLTRPSPASASKATPVTAVSLESDKKKQAPVVSRNFLYTS